MLPSIRRLAGIASIFLLHTTPSTAQTYSNCNPLTQGGCPADSALGKTVNIDFTSGASDSFTAQGSPTYDSNGVSFTVAKSGDSPQLTSKWYIMFGKVSVTLKAAPGVGIVSSVVLQSDDLDEIDWEWLGADSSQVQTNYFGKGITGSYDRGAFHPNSGSQSEFITYTIEWTANQIVWQINGQTVRALTPATADSGQYPQTPMQVKIGAWSGGDPSNSQGTITWAGGNTNYGAGPYTMQVKSVSVSDYSTGTQYSYQGNTGNWQDISAAGGSVYSGGSTGAGSAAPAVTSVSTGQPIPFEGTHRSQDTSTPTGYPWVPLATTMSTATYTNYPGLPSGWTVTSSGKVVPPSSAPSVFLDASSTSWSPQSSLAASLSDESEVSPIVATITYQPAALSTSSNPTPAPPTTLSTSSTTLSTSSAILSTSSAILSTSSTTLSTLTTLSTSTTSSTTSSATTTSRQGRALPSTPAVPVQQTVSLASMSLPSLYPTALLTLGMAATLFML